MIKDRYFLITIVHTCHPFGVQMLETLFKETKFLFMRVNEVLATFPLRQLATYVGQAITKAQ